LVTFISKAVKILMAQCSFADMAVLTRGEPVASIGSAFIRTTL